MSMKDSAPAVTIRLGSSHSGISQVSVDDRLMLAFQPWRQTVLHTRTLQHAMFASLASESPTIRPSVRDDDDDDDDDP